MPPKQDHIHDLVVLGRAAPEPIKDGRHTVCLGGYSESRGYVRIYPTQRRMDSCKRWNVVSVPVEEPTLDDREESYKIAGSQEDWGQLHTKIEQVDRLSKSERIRLADQLAEDCSIRLNENRISLGMVRPAEIMDVYIEDNPDAQIQMDLKMNERKGKSGYGQKLYIKYRCEDCEAKTYHDQHTVEWGVFRYWDTHDDVKGVIEALDFHKEDMNHYFFVGNLNNERQAYIIISILRFADEDMIAAGVPPDNQDDLDEWI